MCFRSLSSLVVTVVLIALCFSVGEGLRLIPFPAVQPVHTNLEHSSPIGGSSQLSVFTSGPIDIPAQPQKRSKRVAIDFFGPVSVETDELLVSLSSSPAQPDTKPESTLLVAFPSDRAPPLTV